MRPAWPAPSVPALSVSLPVLYSFRRCPYAMRARLALHVAGVACELREVVLRDKPDEMLAASPKGTVPVLVLPDGRVIDESLAVMDYALAINDPEDWRNPAIEQDSRALIGLNDGPFKQALDRYKYSTRYDDADPVGERTKGADFLARLDNTLADRPFLFGERRGYADVAIAPFVRQFAFADRGWFDEQPWPGLHRWLEAFLAWDRFAAVMRKVPRWQPSDSPTVVFD